MIKNQIFDLKKIKELIFPIEELQHKVEYLTQICNEFKQNKEKINQNFLDQNFIDQVGEINIILDNVSGNLTKIPTHNIKVFFEFQYLLIKKYKEKYLEILQKKNINENQTKLIGLYLIQEKKINKIIEDLSYIRSIEINQWLELIDSLKNNSNFLNVIKKVNTFYDFFKEEKFKFELNKISESVNDSLLKDFKKAFQENPNLTFKLFLQNLENNLTKEDLSKKWDIIQKAKEKDELEKLKMKQEEQKKTYEQYLKLSEKEFERMRRKKRREKLTDYVEVDKKEIEISDDISEKIEKFKSKFENRFDDIYLTKKDETTDPIDLIRSRKKRKDNEYKKYKNHFKKDKN